MTACQLLRWALKHLPRWRKSPGTDNNTLIPWAWTYTTDEFIKLERLDSPKLGKVTGCLGEFIHRPSIGLFNSAPIYNRNSHTLSSNRYKCKKSSPKSCENVCTIILMDMPLHMSDYKILWSICRWIIESLKSPKLIWSQAEYTSTVMSVQIWLMCPWTWIIANVWIPSFLFQSPCQ